MYSSHRPENSGTTSPPTPEFDREGAHDLVERLASSEGFDLTPCEWEPIHIPGAIQPHGALLALNPADFSLAVCSANAPVLFGFRPTGSHHHLHHHPLESLIGGSLAAEIRNAADAGELDGSNPYRTTGVLPDGRALLDYAVHNHDGFIIVEAEPTTSNTRRQFADAHNRVSTVAQLHQRLYQTDKLQSVEFDQYLHGMCDDLSSSMLSEGEEYTLEVEADPAELSTDRAIPLALIVNELVSNAVKYAYPPGADGTIRVSFTRQENGGYRLVVSDQGAGLPANFKPSDGRLGYEVCAITATAEDAIRLAGEILPDIVLMDIRLAGEMDGITAAQEIRERFGIGAIFMTANSDPATRALAENARPLGFIAKPYSPMMVKTMLRGAAERLGPTTRN